MIHRVELRSPSLLGKADHGPALLERTDRRFMPNALAELGDPSRHDELRGTIVAARKGGGLQLYQPVHRVFHLAVVGAVCADMPRTPRLDPVRIDSAGLVVRKVRDGRGRELGELGWISDKDGRSRWEPPDLWDPQARQGMESPRGGATALRFADPEPTRRPRRSTGRADLDERIAVLKQRGSSRAEAVTPVFPLPPKSCAAVGETLLLGLVPTASRATEEAPQLELPDRDALEEGGFFPERLTVAGSNGSVPFARDVIDVNEVNVGANAKRLDPAFAAYIAFVRDMLVTFDMEGTSTSSATLRSVLKKIELPFEESPGAKRTYKSAYDHLVEAGRVLVEGDKDASFQMPVRWGAVSRTQETAIKDAALGIAKARFTAVSVDRARFGDRDAEYVVRVYVRVRRDDGCPPDLWWSEPSAAFKIAPWYDASPGPVPTIELPDPLRDGLGSIKPNVAFAVPPVLSNLLGKNSPEDILGGKDTQADGSGLMWLCSFSIPIITICAFILLNLMISLLNIVFWWLPFVKICIPIPKR